MLTPTVFADDRLNERLEQLEDEVKALRRTDNSKSNNITTRNNTQFSYGGFIKADAMFSNFSDAQRALVNQGDRFLIPSTIAVNGTEGGGVVFDSTVQTSRFHFKTVTETENGSITSYIEADFANNADERVVNRAATDLRHAFLKWETGSHAVLAGQHWSGFMNTGALVETVDFIGVTSGTIFIRQMQFRYTHKFNKASSFSISLENPSTDLDDGGSGISSNNFDNNRIPDIVGRLDGKVGDLSYSVSALAREIAYDQNGFDDRNFGLGFSGSGKFALGGEDSLRFMISHGNLGRYIALNTFGDGVIETDGDIDLRNVTGGFVAYQHFWGEKSRSTFLFAASTADNPSSAQADLTKTVSNFNINYLYSPVKKLTFGAELIFAERETESGADGDLQRLQFMTKWIF